MPIQDRRRVYVVSASILLVVIFVIIIGSLDQRDYVFDRSLTEIIVEPAKFSGDKMSVTGFLVEDNGLKLFLTKDHAEIRDLSSALLVSWPSIEFADALEKQCVNQYVTIWGSLNPDRSMAYYRLDNIKRIEAAGPNHVCWKAN